MPIQSYSRALYIGTVASTAVSYKGKCLLMHGILVKYILIKIMMDIMQYFMLEGPSDNTEAIERTKYSVSTIEKAGIKTQQVSLKICDWLEDLAYNATKSVYEKYKDQIEVIIANNDAMAIGAIKALQEYGYNKGDKLKQFQLLELM